MPKITITAVGAMVNVGGRVKFATRGQVVDVELKEAKRLEGAAAAVRGEKVVDPIGPLPPRGVTDTGVDAAAAALAALSPAPDGSAPPAPPSFDAAAASDPDLDAWLESASPNAAQVVAAAGGDAQLAQRLINAETRVNDEPRKSVVEPLTKLVDDATAPPVS